MDIDMLSRVVFYSIIATFVVAVIMQLRWSAWKYTSFEGLTLQITIAWYIFTAAMLGVSGILFIILFGINRAVTDHHSIEYQEIILGVLHMVLFVAVGCGEQWHVRRCVRRQHKLFLAAKAAQPAGGKADK